MKNSFYSAPELGLDLAVLVIKNIPSVHFTVNNSTEIVEDGKKIARTKWLIKTIKEIQTKYDYLETVACNNDGKGEYRAAMFAKIGFVRTSTTDFHMTWGTKSEVQEENFFANW